MSATGPGRGLFVPPLPPAISSAHDLASAAGSASPAAPPNCRAHCAIAPCAHALEGHARSISSIAGRGRSRSSIALSANRLPAGRGRRDPTMACSLPIQRESSHWRGGAELWAERPQVDSEHGVGGSEPGSGSRGPFTGGRLAKRTTRGGRASCLRAAREGEAPRWSWRCSRSRAWCTAAALRPALLPRRAPELPAIPPARRTERARRERCR